jgi:hypothetical protein
MNMICSSPWVDEAVPARGAIRERQGTVFIVSEDPERQMSIAPVCDFLDLDVQIVTGADDLASLLRMQRPMAVIADTEGADQDGFHAMKLVAGYNRDLPVMLLTEGDPAMMGAADAIQELWGLRSVTLTSGYPAAGQIVAFLFSAGRTAGHLRLVPV